MPELPSSQETIRDPGIGLAQVAAMTPIVCGVTSSGTVDTLTWFTSSDSLVSALGDGPAVDEALHILQFGGGPVGVLKVDPSVAADNGSVTKSGSGPDVSVAGSATNDFYVVIRIILGGALGTATFQYSLDGWDGATDDQRTWSGTLTVPSGGEYVLPGTGLTVTFADDTYVADETYSWQSECAAANASDLADAFDALASVGRQWRFCDLVTSANNGVASAHATLAAALDSELNTLANTSGRYRRGMISADNAADASAVTAAFTNVFTPRVLVAYGRVSRLAGKKLVAYERPRTSARSCFAARAASVAPSTDLKRVLSGPLPGVLELHEDEATTSTGLDDIYVSTLRTWAELPGYFIAQGRLKAAIGSDFRLWPLGIVMDIACEVVHEEQVKMVGRGYRLNTTGENVGALDERDIIRLEKDVNTRLVAELMSPTNEEGTAGHVSAMRYRINRTHNVAQTETIIGDFTAVPLTYPSKIQASLGYALTV